MNDKYLLGILDYVNNNIFGSFNNNNSRSWVGVVKTGGGRLIIREQWGRGDIMSR